MAGHPSGADIGAVDRFVGAWMRLAHRFPRTALGILAVLLILSGLAIPRIGVDADSTNMLSPDLPAQQRAAALNEAFPRLKDAIVLVVRAPQADAADLAAAALVARLESGTERIESVFAPSVSPFFAAHGFLYSDPEQVAEMFAQLSKSANLLAGLRSDQTVEGFFGALDQAAALAAGAGIGPEGLDPLLAESAAVIEARIAGGERTFAWGSLMEGAGATAGPVTRLVTVTPVLDTTRLGPARAALDEIEAAIAALPPGIAAPVEIGITGEPALRVEEIESVFDTIWLSTALSFVLLFVMLRIGLRASGRSVVALISLVVSVVLTSGFVAVGIGTLNLVSVAFVVLTAGLGIEYAIHILANVAEIRRQGVPPDDAVEQTGRMIGLALTLSALSTSAGFLAFTLTDFAGMAQLGLIGAVGIMLAFAVAATLIPAICAIRPRTAGSIAPRAEPMRRLRRMRALPYIVLAVGVAAIWPAAHARFDADPIGLRDPASRSVLAFEMLAADPETTPYRASVLAPSAEAAAAIAERLAEVPEVGDAMTIRDLIPRDQDEKLMLLDIAAPSLEHALRGEPTQLAAPDGDEPLIERLQRRLAGLPGAGERLAATLAEYQAGRTPATDAALQQDLFRSFPLLLGRLEAMLSADFVTGESLPDPLRGRFVSPEGAFRVEIRPAENLAEPAAISRFVEAVERVAPEVAGGPVQLAAAGSTVERAVLFATALAALTTAVLAWYSTRRMMHTLAILVPLGIAGAVTAAASVLFDMPFNYANVIVLPLMLAMSVDSGVHIALRERSAPGAVFATATPRAVLLAAVTNIAAFGTLALSDHRGISSMGVLLSVSVLAAVCAVLGLTPAMIRWAARRDRRRAASS